jgi:hypothetical protein
MPVPSYTPIADSEIDPESPITSSLIQRLRDNWLSLFGIDPSDPAPVIGLPSSILGVGSTGRWNAWVQSGGTTSAEEIISVILDSVEWMELRHSASSGMSDNPASTLTNNGNVHPHFSFGTPYSDYTTIGGGIYQIFTNVRLVQTIYSSGNPTGVRIVLDETIHYVDGGGTLNVTQTSHDVTVPLTNTFVTIRTSTFGTIQAKARALSGQVLLTWNASSAATGIVIDIPFNRRVFVNKAAV